MKRNFTLFILLFSSLSSFAQHKNNPRLYYRQFNNEYIKIQIRVLNYYEAALRDEDRVKVLRYHEAVQEQLKESLKEISNTAPFREDENLKIGYLNGLDSLVLIFNRDFARARELGRFRLESHVELEKYYQCLDSAETKVKDTYASLEEAEESFARENDMVLKRDEERARREKLFHDVVAHIRPVTLSFYKVHHPMANFMDTVAQHKNMDMAVFMLPGLVDELTTLMEEGKSLAKEFEVGELKKDLKKGLETYISEVKADLKKTARPVTATLDAQPFHTNGFRDARIDFEFYAEDYATHAKKFLKTREDFIREYYPD